MASDRRSFLDLAAFAAPSVALAALGLPLAAVGAAFMLVRLFDIMFDPLFGTFMDRTQFRWGRFKPWLAIGAPLVMIGGYMLFMAQSGVGVLYLWFWLLVAFGGFSICVLAQTAWGSTLSRDYHERSRVYSFWQTGNVIGIIAILAVPVLVALLPGAAGRIGGVAAMGLFVVFSLPLTVGAALARVDEPLQRRAPGQLPATLGDYFRLFRRDTVRRLLSADLLFAIATNLTGTLFFFYFERVKGFTKTQAEILLPVYFVAAIVGGPLWGALARRYGKAQVMIAAALSYVVVQIAVVFLPAGNLPLAIPFLFAAGLPYSSANILLRAMLADAGDEERLLTGHDRTGLLYAILTGTGKIGAALAVGVTFFGLSMLGFKAGSGEVSSSLGLAGLQGLYAAAPAVLGLLAACTMIGYPLTQARHGEIRRRLAERDALESDRDDATPAPSILLSGEAV